MTAKYILERTYLFCQDSYQSGVNPLPLLRRVYPGFRFEGGEFDPQRGITTIHFETFVVEVDGLVKKYFLAVHEVQDPMALGGPTNN